MKALRLTKHDLVSTVAARLGLTQKAVGEVLDAVTAFIAEAHEAGDHVALPGFGTFRSAERAARTGRNPATGEPVDVPAKRVLVFKPSKKGGA